jgi:hypothetical protein
MHIVINMVRTFTICSLGGGEPQNEYYVIFYCT